MPVCNGGHIFRFFPESCKLIFGTGRSSDLFRVYRLPTLAGQWHSSDKQHIQELTAAGTVQDFHLIPFSSA